MLDMGGKRQPGGRERKGHKLCYAMPRKPLAFFLSFQRAPIRPRPNPFNHDLFGQTCKRHIRTPFPNGFTPTQSVSEKCHLTTKVAL